MPMTSTEMIRLLLKNGFIQVKGGKGSHKKFFNPITDHRKELKKGTEQAILKQAGLK